MRVNWLTELVNVRKQTSRAILRICSAAELKREKEMEQIQKRIQSALPTNTKTEEPCCILLRCRGYKEVLSNE